MQLTQLTYGLNQKLLLEANLLNVKDLYNDVSIVAYAQKYAQGIGDKALATAFVSKFSKFMLNDDRWHSAVRQLPPDAPEWAVNAFNKRDLEYFKPDDALNERMEHIVHYLEAIAEASKKTNPDPDGRVFAQREIQALPKLESFDLLVQKSNEYFKRGSKKAKNDISGMKEIYDTGDGFIWYILTDAAAFQREGKVMQNCLGSYWTLSKAKENGQSVVVMKKTNGESVVAARIENDTNEIMEMKGKNNKPPIDAYMGGVLDFIRARNLKIGVNAKNDFERAGYFYIDDKLYTRQEAINKFVTYQDIANVGNKKLVKLNIHPEVVGLLTNAYKGFGNKFINARRFQSKSIYELRDGSGFAVMSALVDDSDKELVGLHRAKRQAKTNVVLENVDSTSVVGRELIKALFQNDIIEHVSKSMHHDLWWNDRLEVGDNGEIKPIPHDKIKSKGGYQWEKHTHPAHRDFIKSHVEQGVGRVASIGHDNTKAAYLATPSPAEQDQEDVSHFAAIATHHKPALGKWPHDSEENPNERGMLIPSKVNSSRYSGYVGHGNASHQRMPGAKNFNATGIKHLKNIKSIVDLANEENLDLPKNFKYNSGVVTDKDGKHRIFDDAPKKITDEPPAAVFDLSKYSDTDKLTIINHLATSPQISPIERTEHNSGHNVRTNVLLHQPGIHVSKRRSMNAQSPIQDDLRNDSAETPDTKIARRYRNGVIPDKIYIVQVKYGNDKKHTVILSANGKKITQVDGLTRTHDFQHWGDVDKIAEQLNKVMDAAGLTITKGILNKADAKELRIAPGTPRRFTSAGKVAEKRIEKLVNTGAAGTEGADELPFKDGAKLKKMDPSDQALWLRTALKSYKVPGVAWQVIDKKGNVTGTVFVKNNKIVSGFHSNPEKEGEQRIRYNRGYKTINVEPGTIPGISTAMIPDLQTAMKEFGWTLSEKALAALRDNDTNNRTAFRRVARGNGNLETIGDSPRARMAREWARRGWVKKTGSRKEPNAHKPGETVTHETWSITQKGKEYAEQLHQAGWSNISPMDFGKPAELEDGFEVPAPKEEEKKQRAEPTRTPRPVSTATRSGTKAEQALDLFRQYVTDNDEMPSRREFMTILQDEPFNMSPAGASTYYANTKKKYAALNEKYSILAGLQLMVEQHLFLGDFI